ncbi:hypothetical protein [Roseateles sp.]|uniref:hypothetical protein n=1 Tax=Roseateles sp. TaxID=1971397 RepID=UPI0025E8FFE6|nr:hypothetical protein [Roseateles sp.]MBV8034326.1 hypothetical protein [Roseateles sp.]
MTTDKMVFRSVYVDPDVDQALRAQAAESGVSKGEMFRTYLAKGMRSKRAAGMQLDAGVTLAMRTVYLPAEVDDELRTRAFMLRTTKSDLIRKYLWAGMTALQRAAQGSARTRTRHQTSNRSR